MLAKLKFASFRFQLVCVRRAAIPLSFFILALIFSNHIDLVWDLTASDHPVQNPVSFVVHVVDTVSVNFCSCSDCLSRSKPLSGGRHTGHEVLDIVETVYINFKCVGRINFLNVKVST